MLKTFGAILSTLALFAHAPGAFAQQAPMPPLVRMIVPFSPGASTDVIARAVAAQLGPRLGTSVIVENKPGASGFIGAAAVAKGPKDGSSLLELMLSDGAVPVSVTPAEATARVRASYATWKQLATAKNIVLE